MLELIDEEVDGRGIEKEESAGGVDSGFITGDGVGMGRE